MIWGSIKSLVMDEIVFWLTSGDDVVVIVFGCELWNLICDGVSIFFF